MTAINLPANISIARARLPETYENAKTALTKCNSIDECKDWADKAEALASYARMADDDALRQLADRIQARSVRRAGELLKTFKSAGGRPPKTLAGTHPSYSQQKAAQDAGMSPHQTKIAVRVANLDAREFEAAVEGDNPPTVTELATRGTKTRPVPEGFAQATHLLGTVKRFSEFCAKHSPEHVAQGVMPSEVSVLREHVATIDGWLDRFVVNLKG